MPIAAPSADAGRSDGVSVLDFERTVVADYRARTLVGTAADVRARIDALVEATGALGVMIMTMVHDHAARLRSYELLASEMTVGNKDTKRMKDRDLAIPFVPLLPYSPCQ